MSNYNPMLITDFYKQSHIHQYPKGTELVYSTWTPRESRIEGINEVVVFGHQYFIKKYLIDYFNEHFFYKQKIEVVEDWKRVIKACLSISNPDSSHIESLHDLGYLPIVIYALPEGTMVPIRTPCLTIINTLPEFYWLTNALETLMSCELWPMYTSATIAREYKKILDEGARKTEHNGFTSHQGHDFSFRGMMGVDAAVKTGMGHLLSFISTDTVPSILALEKYYGAKIDSKDIVGCSIPATEHSIQCTYENDEEYLHAMLDIYPTGIFSIVCDGYDFWNFLDNILPKFKEKIMKRNGKVVIRPDSGDPVKILCGDYLVNMNEEYSLSKNKGAVQRLWEIFGGHKTDGGFKVLESHIGIIYGDSITLDRARKIMNELESKSFSTINVVLGIGSYTYQYVTRDTFGFALKSTLCFINGKEKHIFKNPKTDNGTKKSQKGAVIVYKKEDGSIAWDDNHTLLEFSKSEDNLLEIIFLDGKLLEEVSLEQIRKRMK